MHDIVEELEEKDDSLSGANKLSRSLVIIVLAEEHLGGEFY